VPMCVCVCVYVLVAREIKRKRASERMGGMQKIEARETERSECEMITICRLLAFDRRGGFLPPNCPVCLGNEVFAPCGCGVATISRLLWLSFFFRGKDLRSKVT